MVVDVQGRLDEADEYLHQALDIFKKEQNYDLMLQTMGELAFVMEKNGQNAKAMSVYNSMLQLYKYNNDSRRILTTNQRMGGVSLALGQYSQAYHQLKYSLKLSDSLGYNVQKDKTLVRLVKSSAHLGKLTEMEEFVNQLSRYHREQETKNIERTITDLETSHQLNEQKLENEILRAETKNQKLEILNFRYLIGGSIGFLAILVVLFITVYRYNSKISKYSEELSLANAELERHVAAKTELLDSRNLQLIQASFALAHEIRAKVSTILGAAELIRLEKGEDGTNQY
jgi:tetratricopeptide (TPR) repeat protein